MGMYLHVHNVPILIVNGPKTKQKAFESLIGNKLDEIAEKDPLKGTKGNRNFWESARDCFWDITDFADKQGGILIQLAELNSKDRKYSREIPHGENFSLDIPDYLVQLDGIQWLKEHKLFSKVIEAAHECYETVEV